MKNQFDKRVTLLSLLRETFPTVIMMIIFSLYTIIDGIFISRLVGDEALAATNVVYPCINILLGIGIMFATGGSAVVAKKMGEGKYKEANEGFSLITISALISGIIVAITSLIFIKDLIYLLGSTKTLYKYCYSYLSIMMIFTPFIILKVYFDYFLVTGGAAKLGLVSSISGGVVNVVLDYIFIVNLDMGVSGAALATCIGYILPSIIGIVYFFKRSNVLHFSRPIFNISIIKKSCSNGMSEMVNQLSASITTFLYNITMIKYLGESGVAAITIILYIQFLLCSAYLGFTSGAAPRISYNYGKKNRENLKRLVKYSYIIVIIFAICTFTFSIVMSKELIGLFAVKGSHVFDVTLKGFLLFSISFLMSGINIFTCGMFTAYSNGKVSAIISFLRSLIFFIIGIIILPQILGENGIWLVAPFAEAITLLVSIKYLMKYRKEYMY